ncbi:NADAR family protein [Massilia sp. CF038]|uniref:NADAR family protein n=1 Tax=Massilia sp. CF038 TaxID=1881045 RepID=UPI0009191B8D|nr:NADAR family protein [Massilia sp. CF038]SHG48809.1 hypothetical protein SAMN05428948_0693 [Massilia sp. CF038]
MNASDIRSCDSLLDYLDRGGRPKYLLFWGHSAANEKIVTKACFSQWFGAPFDVDGVSYRTAEHFMMAEKARLFGDAAALAQVLAARSPAQAKAAGRGVLRFDETLWQEKRWEIVVRANVAKFAQHQALAAFLLQTKDRILVEASPVDKIWGIGLAADDPHAEHPRRWKGLNLLGFALMEARTRLQAAGA